MTTAIAVEIFPAHPIRRLAAPSSASTKDSAFCNASSDTPTTSSLGGVVLSADMLSPGTPLTPRPGVPRAFRGRIQSNLGNRGKGLVGTCRAHLFSLSDGLTAARMALSAIRGIAARDSRVALRFTRATSKRETHWEK